MQAIILAAGMGRRLGEWTKNQTKCMVPVNGVRLIDRVLGQLSKLSLQRVIIVVGYQGKALRDYIGHRYDDLLKIEYAENPIYDKTNNIYSLSLVKEQLQEDDTLLIESDLILSDRLFGMLMENPIPTLPSSPNTRHGWTVRWYASMPTTTSSTSSPKMPSTITMSPLITRLSISISSVSSS